MLGYVIAVAIIGCIGWAVLNPFAGLLALVAVYVIRPGELYPIVAVLHPERVLALVVLGSLFLNKGKLNFPPITRKILFLWGAMMLAIPLAFWKSAALFGALNFGIIILYNVLIVNLVNTPDRFRKFLWVYVLLIGWLAFSTYTQGAQGNFEVRNGLERAVGMTSSASDPNALGLTLVSGLPIVLLFCGEGSFKRRLAAIAIAGMSVWIVVLTGSRTSFLNLIILCAIFIITRKKGFAYFPVAVLLMATVWFVMPKEYQHRYLSVEDTAHDESYQNRVRSWHAGWAMFKDYPLTGVGCGVFPVANGTQYFPGHPKLWMQPHNLYVQVMAETGTVGIICFLVFHFALIGTNLRLRKQLRGTDDPLWMRAYPSACLFSLLALYIAGYSGHSFYRDTWYMLAALTSALDGLIRSREQNEIPASGDLDQHTGLELANVSTP